MRCPLPYGREISPFFACATCKEQRREWSGWASSPSYASFPHSSFQSSPYELYNEPIWKTRGYHPDIPIWHTASRGPQKGGIRSILDRKRRACYSQWWLQCQMLAWRIRRPWSSGRRWSRRQKMALWLGWYEGFKRRPRWMIRSCHTMRMGFFIFKLCYLFVFVLGMFVSFALGWAYWGVRACYNDLARLALNTCRNSAICYVDCLLIANSIVFQMHIFHKMEITTGTWLIMSNLFPSVQDRRSCVWTHISTRLPIIETRHCFFTCLGQLKRYISAFFTFISINKFLFSYY